MHCVVSEHFAVLAHLNGEQLCLLLSTVLAGVPVATLETEPVGSPEVVELALAGEFVVGRPCRCWWSRRNRIGQRRGASCRNQART